MNSQWHRLIRPHHSVWQATQLALFTLIISATSTTAQGIPATWENSLYQPPFDLQAPGSRTQGGTRAGGGEVSMSSLVPLVPLESNFGVTTAAYPSFLVYAPKLEEMTGIESLEFLLLDADGEEVYRARFAATLNQSVLRIELPKHAGLKPLATDQNYLWILEGFAQDFTLGNNVIAHGWIRRVEPPETLQASLKRSQSPTEMAQAYIDHQIWYDAIATLEADVTNGQASDTLLAKWNALLKSAGIGEVSFRTVAMPTILPLQDKANLETSENLGFDPKGDRHLNSEL